MSPNSVPDVCQRCKTNPGRLAMRGQPTCPSCFEDFISTKAVKKLANLGREYRPVGAPHAPATYLVGLSFGPSSAALVHMLARHQEYRAAKNPRSIPIIKVVHVDTSPGDERADDSRGGRATAATSGGGEGFTAQLQTESKSPSQTRQILEEYRKTFPRITFQATHLSSVFDLDTIDWAVFPADQAVGQDPAKRLRALLESLPKASSGVDVVRTLVRHVLLATAEREQCDALLLGATTTALAELTLAEVAKGRGFSVPWLVQDGVVPRPVFASLVSAPDRGELVGDSADGAQDDRETRRRPVDARAGDGNEATTTAGSRTMSVPIFYPLGEVFRAEAVTYTTIVDPPMTHLLPSPAAAAKSDSKIVSHKDLSIEEVMARYFADVETNYPSVVANVVRMTGKLNRAEQSDEGAACALCGMELDEQGDSRWRGEISDTRTTPDEGRSCPGRLCYGCDRSINF